MRPSFHLKDTGFVRLCGHRGQSLDAPENTIAAFRAAHAAGATSMEIDTVLTADGEIIVLHDLLLDRTTNGKGAAAQLTLAEIRTLDAGSHLAPRFAGEPVPTLREAIELAHELDLVLEVEIKEKADRAGYIAALARLMAEPGALDRVMMISFDHKHLKDVKAAIPGIRTGGIVHERYADPVTVARVSNLDQLCIDLDVFALEDAEALHAAGISIRCHAYRPATWEKIRAAGLDWGDVLASALQAGLIDTLSGDDVAWLKARLSEALA